MRLLGKPNVEKSRRHGDVAALAAALRDKDKNVVEAAARALASLGTPAALEPLIDTIRAVGPLEVGGPAYHAAVEVAKHVHDPRCTDRLLRLLDDDNMDVENFARDALRGIGQPVVEPVIAMLPQAKHPAMAAAVLGDIGDARAVSPLIDLVQQSDPWTRQVAAVHLSRLGDEGRRAVIDLARSPDPAVKLALVDVLPDMEGDQATEALVSFLGAGNAQLRKSAALVLAKQGNQAAAEPLLAVVTDGASTDQDKAKALAALQALAWPLVKAALKDEIAAQLSNWHDALSYQARTACEICGAKTEPRAFILGEADLLGLILNGYDPVAIGRIAPGRVASAAMSASVDAARRTGLESPDVAALMVQSVLASDAAGAYQVWKANLKAVSDPSNNRFHGGWTLCPQCAEDVAVFAVAGIVELKRILPATSAVEAGVSGCQGTLAWMERSSMIWLYSLHGSAELGVVPGAARRRTRAKGSGRGRVHRRYALCIDALGRRPGLIASLGDHKLTVAATEAPGRPCHPPGASSQSGRDR